MSACNSCDHVETWKLLRKPMLALGHPGTTIKIGNFLQLNAPVLVCAPQRTNIKASRPFKVISIIISSRVEMPKPETLQSKQSPASLSTFETCLRTSCNQSKWCIYELRRCSVLVARGRLPPDESY
eukprot:6214554-Pleurochrysis_carterae.AAC.2